MFNETVYRNRGEQLGSVMTGINLPAAAVQSLNAQQQARWKQILGAIGTAGLTALTNSIASQTPPAPYPTTLPYNPQYNARTEQENAALREALARREAEESDSSAASFSWTKDGLKIGGGATLSPTMLFLGAAALWLLFKEPPRKGKG
jgi:hypothetical protein